MPDLANSRDDVLRWYAVHTHGRQEDRAESNLLAWQIETFVPRHHTGSSRRHLPSANKTVKPLFPRYIFARFRLNESFHKIRYTRGVSCIVSIAGTAVPVDDELIDLIKSRRSESGLIKLVDDLKAGEDVLVKGGNFEGFAGVFQRSVKGSDRVVILLKAVSYQSHIELPREHIKRVTAGVGQGCY